MKDIFRLARKHWLLLSIVLISAFFRLYKISGYMTFLGDEGRDALVWLRMVRNGKFTLIGPQTSIGNMYLGPLYYYLMLPFYFVLGTVGPSIGVALFGVGTTILLWYCGREWFSGKIGLISAFFYAISPVAIIYNRSSWNPNVMPFFALLTIWGVWQFWQKEKYEWLTIIGITLSFAIQSHYLGLLLLPVAGIFFLLKLAELKKGKDKDKKIKKLFFNFGFCALCFVLLTVLPLVWFDLRHNFLNYNSFYKFFSERQTTVNFKFYKAIPNLWPLWRTLVTDLLAGKNQTFGFWLAIIFGLSAVVFIFHKKGIFLKRKAVLLVWAWLAIGLLGMGLYKQHIYDHYFGFLFPGIFLMAGWIVFQAVNFHRFWKYFSPILILIVLILSLAENPLKYPPNDQMRKVEEIDRKIIELAGDLPYNFALIAKQNYEAGYEYFLELWGKPPRQIDPQKYKETVTEQLFVVCEDPVCDPVTNAKAGIANFGWSKIEQEWSFPWGVRLFKLIHYQK